MNKSTRIGLFGSLYFAQGMAMSYFLTFNILYLGEAGYSAGDVGIFQAIIAIPFVLKILLGMISDGINFFGLGHRRPYIAIGLIGQIVAMGILPSISVADGLRTYAWVALLASVSMALYDTCTDGLALDSTPEDERGLIQGVMVGARAAGILLMLVIGGIVAESLGWSFIFYLIGLISLIPFIMLLAGGVKEDPSEAGQREPFKWEAFRSFGSVGVILLAVMGLLYSIALDGVLTFLSDYLRDIHNVAVGNIGMLVALSMVGRILGALSNGWLTDRIGDRRSLLIAIILAFIGCVGLAINAGVGWIGVFGFIFGLAYGYYTAVYAAVAMRMSDVRISASMFAIFMMFINLGTVGGQVLGGQITDAYGFRIMVVAFGLLNLVNIPLVSVLFRKQPERILAG